MCGEGLAAAVAGVDVAEGPVTIDDMVARVRESDVRWACDALAAGRFDASGLWGLDGSTSAAVALCHHARVSPGRATRLVNTGRLFLAAPELAERALDGRLSADQVQVIVRNVPERARSLFAEQAAEWLPYLEPLTVKETATAMGVWKSRADAIIDGPEPRPERRREFYLTRTDDGVWIGKFTLDDEAGAIVQRGLEVFKTSDCEGEPARDPARRRADALVDTFRFGLDHHQAPPTGRNHPHIDIQVRWDGGPLGPARVGEIMIDRAELIARYLCDARVHRYLVDAESAILDYGRSQRTVSANQFRTLVLHDQHCRWPGCDRPPAWCHAHHVVPWEAGGPTDLDNLVLLCSRHHHLVHEGGFQLKLRPDRQVRITTPTGQVLKSDRPSRLQR